MWEETEEYNYTTELQLFQFVQLEPEFILHSVYKT